MQLIVDKVGDVAVVAVQADVLDASNADDFKEEIEPVLGDSPKLVLDLGRVQFVDSRGCGAILACLKHATERGGDLKLCKVTRPARTVFDLIRLHRICEIVETR
ncbi:MAG: STAS domain-containing protein, partial [Gemmataceae bacterium]